MPSIRARAFARIRRNNALRRFARRRRVRYARFGRKVRMGALSANPMPTFVETYKKTGDMSVINIAPGTGAGQVFKVRITDIPQVNQYANLYKQYRINWVKVMLLPRLNTENTDPNLAIQNGVVAPPTQWMGLARIVYAINDSPGETAPATEQEVLECNGAKIKSFKTKWSCSFKPVPDVAQYNITGANAIYSRQKYRQWFNFDTTLTGNNPEHGAVTSFISIPGNVPPGEEPFVQTYYVYYKVSFTLRDPQ